MLRMRASGFQGCLSCPSYRVRGDKTQAKMRFPASPRRALRAAAAAASFGAMTRLPLHRPALLLPTLALALAGCSPPAPPAANAKLASGEPLATRAVMIGTEGPRHTGQPPGGERGVKAG